MKGSHSSSRVTQSHVLNKPPSLLPPPTLCCNAGMSGYYAILSSIVLLASASFFIARWVMRRGVLPGGDAARIPTGIEDTARSEPSSSAGTTRQLSKGTPKSANNVNDDGGWKCACEEGGMGLFLPASMRASLGGPAAVLRMGAGGCYHKQM